MTASTATTKAEPKFAPRLRSLGPLRALFESRYVRALMFPHSVDHYLELFTPLLSLSRIRAEVVEVVRETSDVVTLTLRPNDNFLGFRAGQYVAVTVEVDGTRHTRYFSLSSSPLRADGLIAITVKARPHGRVSTFLVERARPGMRVLLDAPAGEFVMPTMPPKQLLFISGGSGITPCMSLLRSLLEAGHGGEIRFVHFARTRADVIFGAELQLLAARHRNLRLAIEARHEGRGKPPNLSERTLAAMVPNFELFDAWVCGPASMMDGARRAYASRGAAERVRTEHFSLAARDARGSEAGQIEFIRSQTRVQGDGRSLLDQAEAAGLSPNSGCRIGICQSCKCKKRSGLTRDLRTGDLCAEPNVLIQLCISAPVGDVSIEL